MPAFFPRRSHVTGDISIHEMAWSADELWFVNTLFSCLGTLDPKYSFVPRWRPPFVTKLAPEDRCHLNGLAIVDGKPRYVTALGATDTPDGWRAHKATGGCVIDVLSGETIGRDLSMPHSPRFYRDKLWVLNSGTGQVVTLDTASGKVETIAELPGYARGLAFCDQYAFVGLSRIRDTTTFGNIPIAARRDELKCGVWVIDIETGSVVGFLDFERGVEEIFDVQILRGVHNPAVVGFEKDTIRGAFVLPPEGRQ